MMPARPTEDGLLEAGTLVCQEDACPIYQAVSWLS